MSVFFFFLLSSSSFTAASSFCVHDDDVNRRRGRFNQNLANGNPSVFLLLLLGSLLVGGLLLVTVFVPVNHTHTHARTHRMTLVLLF